MATGEPAAHRRLARRGGRAVIAIAGFAILLGSAPAAPHEAIDAETTEGFLNRIAALNAVIASGESAEKEAEAFYALGEMVARITELLNRDLVMHGSELGLASTVLVSELKAGGIALSFWPAANRYRSYLEPFEEYVALAPGGAKHADALFRILQGRFYDSFVSDPFRLLELDWAGLVAQIDAAEAFLSRYPDHTDKEEALFILAVDYVRAFREASDAELARRYRERSREALTEFQDTYPDSLRAVAAQVLMESLPPVN